MSRWLRVSLTSRIASSTEWLSKRQMLVRGRLEVGFLTDRRPLRGINRDQNRNQEERINEEVQNPLKEIESLGEVDAWSSPEKGETRRFRGARE